MKLIKRIAFLLIALTFWVNGIPASAQVPGYSSAVKTFGDFTNYRPFPTSGAASGVYRNAGPWVQTGAITCSGCRVLNGSSMQFNNAVTVVPGVEGNATQLSYTADASDGSYACGPGMGPGAGFGYVHNVSPGAASGGSGGGHGGIGGAGATGSVLQPGGATYPNELFLPGSSGGASPSGDVTGGGGGFYVESIGPVSFTGAAAVNANAAASTGTFYAGSAGGGIDIRSLGLITVASGATISANGSNGLAGNGGGGGGVINLASAINVTNAGTLSVTGGNGPSGATGGAGGKIVLAVPTGGSPTFGTTVVTGGTGGTSGAVGSATTGVFNGPRLNY